MTRDELREALAHPNVAAFLRVIRQGESGQTDSAYTICFGGSHFDAPPWNHPGKVIVVGRMKSSAAGAYQFLTSTWQAVQSAYGFEDFSPACQDEAAVALIKGRKALDDVIAGRFTSAIGKCNKEWASLPDSPYGQPTMTMAEARDLYERYGGTFAPESSTTVPIVGATTPLSNAQTKGTTMPAPLLIPLFTALLPSIVNLIPALASVFKPGSEVAQRNVAAATVVANTLVEATKSPNLQAAVEAMTNDPEARAAATAAVTAPEVWNLLVDAGPGVETARKAAANPEQLPAHKNPAVWFMAAFIPLVYLASWKVLTGEGFSDDVRMMVLTAIFGGLLASGTAFFLGSSLGSQRKTTMLGGDK